MIDYLSAHWIQIAAAVTSFTTGARVLVKLLPNPSADTKFEQVVDLLKHFGLVVTPPSDVIASAPAGAVPAPIPTPTLTTVQVVTPAPAAPVTSTLTK